MSVIQIRKAQREGARLVIGIAGISGEGKTYTAIQLAYGLANYHAEKVGFLDTENRRGSLYANILQDATPPTHEPFLIGDLYAPFSPQRYIDAIMEFQKAGVEVLVIDSVTHEWEGQGGCEEIAATSNGAMADWKKAKAEHKRFMNAMLQCNMHIIVCIRSREKMDFSNPRAPKKLGTQPVQEKNFMFEMTASMQMWNKGKTQEVLKCPAELLPILGRNDGYLSAQDGKDLRDWVDGAKQLDPEVERYRNGLQTVTERGMGALADAWSKTPAHVQKALGNAFKDQLKASAMAFDAARAAGTDEGLAGIEDLNDAITNGHQPDVSGTVAVGRDTIQAPQKVLDDDPF